MDEPASHDHRRAVDLETDAERAVTRKEEDNIRKIDDMTDFRIVAIARAALLEQAIRFILNARKTASATPGRGEASTTATLTNAQWEQIEELLNP